MEELAYEKNGKTVIINKALATKIDENILSFKMNLII